MRHSDINLTMGIHAHLRLLDKARAVDKLPTLRDEVQGSQEGE
mgnify:CR=1 FL=1